MWNLIINGIEEHYGVVFAGQRPFECFQEGVSATVTEQYKET